MNKMVDGTKKYFKRNAGILIGLALICIVITVNSPQFLTQNNIMNVLRQISSNMFLASSMTMVLIAGGIDLSVGSGISMIGVMAGTFLNMNIPIPVVIIICLIAGALIGSVNGTIISRTTLPPFIVTYSIQSILKGGTYVFTGGTTVRIDNRVWTNLGTGYAFGVIPYPVIYLSVVFVIVWLVLNKTKLGRHIYAVGGNEKAARFSGINVIRTRMFVYIFSGVMAALAGMVLCARQYSGNPLAGDGAEMDAIAAVVVGGTSMAGGSGKIGGTIIGALIIGVLNNGLNLMNVNSFWQDVVKGVVILLAVFIDYIRNRK